MIFWLSLYIGWTPTRLAVKLPYGEDPLTYAGVNTNGPSAYRPLVESESGRMTQCAAVAIMFLPGELMMDAVHDVAPNRSLTSNRPVIWL